MEINKDLIAASSTPLVLAILAEEDSYGYAILQRVRELSGGRMTWTDGMLYPVPRATPSRAACGGGRPLADGPHSGRPRGRLGQQRWAVERPLARRDPFRWRAIRYQLRVDLPAAFLAVGSTRICVTVAQRCC
jgi:hypothetical protein